MGDDDFAKTGLAQAVARFPEAAAALKRLALTSPDFREICEEYAVAQQSLAGFEARLDAAERPEIGDSRTVIAELEKRDRPISAGGRNEGLTTGAEARHNSLVWRGGLGGTPK